ncbi:hypothetical protein TBC1_112138 [Lentimicrobium saccharophilum]|jgi:transposase|uniref:Helix-turn-helix domain-containing protein n=1 Tax=Lentimicrobium saccharophilum TaxID=1678841 RepID=A0A0S7BZE8_9BACT|nr:helix-turn-helix domain-containing protein [Lentimicrobium saccharophilum]GAP43979.1 hypothetical protein TBC1_112138 [Lentimicrobium saccharophilum]
MENYLMTTLSESDLQRIVEKAIESHEIKKTALLNAGLNYSFAKVAQIFGRSHTTIKNLVKAGKLKTTADGRRITQAAINEYLKTSQR